MTICGLSLHHRNTESRKNLEQKFIFQLRYTLSSRNQLIPLIYSQIHVAIFPPMAKLLHTCIKTNNTQNSSGRSEEGLTLETSAFQIVHGGNSTFINTFDKTQISCSFSHRRSTTVSLETRNLSRKKNCPTMNLQISNVVPSSIASVGESKSLMNCSVEYPVVPCLVSVQRGFVLYVSMMAD